MSGESIAEWVPLVRDVVLMVVVPLAAWAVRKWVLADAGDKRRREVADGARRPNQECHVRSIGTRSGRKQKA